NCYKFNILHAVINHTVDCVITAATYTNNFQSCQMVKTLLKFQHLVFHPNDSSYSNRFLNNFFILALTFLDFFDGFFSFFASFIIIILSLSYSDHTNIFVVTYLYTTISSTYNS